MPCQYYIDPFVHLSYIAVHQGKVFISSDRSRSLTPFMNGSLSEVPYLSQVCITWFPSFGVLLIEEPVLEPPSWASLEVCHAPVMFTTFVTA